MSDSEKSKNVAENQPILGTVIGAALTYWLSADRTGSSQVMLATVTPIAMAIDRGAFRLFKYVAAEHQKRKRQAEFSAAIAHIDAHINSPILSSMHKDQLQDVRQTILIDQVQAIAYNRPQPNHNDKPILQSPRNKQRIKDS